MNIMKFFGFENDDEDYDDDDSYQEERRTPKKSPAKSTRSSSQGNPNAAGRLIRYKGVAPDADKHRLRDAFNEGAMILIDLNELDQREFEETGKDFITFMGGIAFSRGGKVNFIEPAQYLLTPRADMYETWPEGSDIE